MEVPVWGGGWSWPVFNNPFQKNQSTFVRTNPVSGERNWCVLKAPPPNTIILATKFQDDFVLTITSKPQRGNFQLCVTGLVQSGCFLLFWASYSCCPQDSGNFSFFSQNILPPTSFITQHLFILQQTPADRHHHTCCWNPHPVTKNNLYYQKLTLLWLAQPHWWGGVKRNGKKEEKR